ncbi:PAS domain S-box protein, partial [bacterium]|nr:PAS domain S-box protein [bacterium]
MIKALIPEHEEERLKTLNEYDVFDDTQDLQLDEITKIAALVCRCEIALVSLVDRDRQRFKSRQGLEVTSTPRDISFCAHAIMGDELFIVEDAEKDERFFDNPLFLEWPHVRFYAGAPLIAPNGHRIGTLCVIDSEVKALDDSQKLLLKTLSNQVINVLELRKKNQENDRKKAELENYNSGLDFHTIISKINTKGELTSVTNKFCEISKYSKKELIGKNHRILDSQFHPREFFAKMWETLSSGQSWHGEVRNKAKDGSLYWVDCTMIPIKNLKGEIFEYMAFEYDITSKKEAEDLSKETQSIAKVGGWNLNIQTFETKWSEETYRIHEIEIGSQTNAEDGINFYAEHERPRIKEMIANCIKKGTPFESDFEFISAKGNKKWVHSKGVPERDAHGNIINVRGIFQDITHKKSREIELKNTENKLRQLFTQQQDAVMTLEPPNWKFTSCNPATLDLFKIKSETEFTDLGPWSVSPERQADGELSTKKAERMISKALKEGRCFFEWTHKSTDGMEFPCT